MNIETPTVAAIHRAICEDSITECLDDNGHCVKAAAAVALPQPVLDFINQRPEYINALKNTRGDDLADYYRWNGHAEARRQLAQGLGYTVPHNTSEKTEKDTK